jgi:hypothetical protein
VIHFILGNKLNIYLVLEDKYGKDVYSKWVKYINPSFVFVNDIRTVQENNIFTVSGMGYPYYFEMIEAAIEDINNNTIFDRLVIAVDSEDMTYNAKYLEIDSFIKTKTLNKCYKIIIQHFCLETWALGNRAIITRNPNTEKLREYQNYFNLLLNDPELLPDYPMEELNRAQFAEKFISYTY